MDGSGSGPMIRNISELRHTITIQKQVETGKDGDGNRLIEWQDFASVRAAAKDMSAREFFAALSAQQERITTFTLRWLDGLRNDMRIMFQGLTYEIVQINHMSYRRDFLEVRARMVDKEGAA